MTRACLALAAFGLGCGVAAQSPPGAVAGSTETVVRRVAPPPGFERARADELTFARFLRELPTRPGRPPVRLFDGSDKGNQEAHHLVLDVDVGRRDLQQCADAVMRLRAEFLWSGGRADEVRFDFTSGDSASFSRWAEGERPLVRGNRVRWQKSAAPDRSYASFRRYLEVVFTYAGTASLSRELVAVDDPAEVRPGDVFIQGGFPGHAVLVLDVARSVSSGERVFLLAQSYMPAQEIHVLRNPADAELSPWYRTDFGAELVTPEWTFDRGHLMRFP